MALPKVIFSMPHLLKNSWSKILNCFESGEKDHINHWCKHRTQQWHADTFNNSRKQMSLNVITCVGIMLISNTRYTFKLKCRWYLGKILFLLIHLPEFTQLSFYLKGHYIRPIDALDMCLLNKMALSKDILVIAWT